MENKQTVSFFIAGLAMLTLAGWVYLSFQAPPPKLENKEILKLENREIQKRTSTETQKLENMETVSDKRQEVSGTYPLSIGEHTIRVELARTEQEQERGLSGRQGLLEDTGMLFLFPVSDIYKFWMKDMLFSIDIIWIDQNGVIVDFKRSISPDTYPAVFEPTVASRYVLEVSAQMIDVLGIKRGDRIDLSSLPMIKMP